MALLLIYIVNGIGFINFVIDPWHGLFSQVMLASYPDLTIETRNVKYIVDVYWDSNGVPYIKAYNFMDLFYAIGYVQAHDRLWQMDFLRRMAIGNLSIVVGEKALEYDKFFRILNLRDIAIKTYEYLKSHKELKLYAEILEAYARGVNDYIDYVINNDLLPLEYKLLGIKPEHWRPWDTIAISKLFAWFLSGSFDDLNLYQLVSRYGVSALKELKLLQRPLTLPIINESSTISMKPDFTPILESIPSFPSIPLSNSWVVSGKLSYSGKPILCNDPHLMLTAPPIWYEMFIECVGKCKIHGVAIPGVPFIIIGRNEHIAWGFTNSLVDVTDFYYYVWDGDRYFYNGSWVDAKVRREVIWVRDLFGVKKYSLRVLETIHGPVIERNGVRVAIRWTGFNVTLEVVALFELNMASNCFEALKAMRYFSSLPLNMVVADVFNNIAYKLVGTIPIRKKSLFEGIVNYGFLPFNGSRCEGDWIGNIPYDKLPEVINPREGFIVTANNMPVNVSTYSYYIGWNWHDRYRYKRIVDLIRLKSNDILKLTLDDMMEIQLDIYEPEAPILLDLTLRCLRGHVGELNELERKALELLEKWDYEMKANAIQPTIYYYFMYNLHYGIWDDELRESGIGDRTFIKFEVTEYVLKTEVSKPGSMYKWINSSLDELVLKSFKEAILGIVKTLGPNINEWKWGNVHRYVVKHALGDLFSFLNLPEVPANGGTFTVNVAPWTKVTIGPGLRFIANLGSNKDLIIIAGGNSGNPVSPTYDNQYDLWVKGMYRIVYLTEVTSSNKVGSLSIKPA